MNRHQAAAALGGHPVPTGKQPVTMIPGERSAIVMVQRGTRRLFERVDAPEELTTYRQTSALVAAAHAAPGRRLSMIESVHVLTATGGAENRDHAAQLVGWLS